MRGIIVMLGLVLLRQCPSFSQNKPLGAGANDPLSDSKTLKIITINVWSGLDYQGDFKFGEYESSSRREIRFAILVQQLKDLNPDILFVQEANPVGEYATRLADSLGFDEIHQVCNAGIKLLGFGLPSNFEEGIAILARKDLHLKEYAVWKLSGSFGLLGDFLSMNFDEAEFAQVGQITVDDRPVFLINLHLSAFPPNDSTIVAQAHGWYVSGRITKEQFEEVDKILSMGSTRRLNEVDVLLDNVSELPKSVPIVLGGDFNAESTSPEVEEVKRQGGFASVVSNDLSYTWDSNRNPNINFSTQMVDADGEELDFADKLSAVYDRKPRIIDYIFISDSLRTGEGLDSRVVLDSVENGLYTSDHFGVMADIGFPLRLNRAAGSSTDAAAISRASIEPLPIISYDTDTRFGYGAKLFLFNLMKMKESFDMVLFNSTKGERWYRGVFSYPDFESRQGTVYPIAFDFTFDYDKWIKNNFYGVGNNSLLSNHEFYTREPMEFDLGFSRGFTSQIVGQAIIKHESIRNFNFEDSSRLEVLAPSLNSSTARYTSIDLTLRLDTRNSFVNPSHGIVLQGESEFSPSWSLGNTSFTRLGGWFQYYSVLFYPTTVFALRVGLQRMIGDSLPVQVLTSIGGTNNLRGYPQDRYLDKASALMNAELRFPIFWRIGGVVGADAGKVWQSLSSADLRDWAFNPVVGLRLYMDNYVVRADLGFGRDGTGFYFNFGQLF